MIPNEIYRPGQVVCFKPFPFQTIKDGTIFMFFAIDMYSHYAFAPEHALNLDDASIMTQVHRLVHTPDFMKSLDGPFVVVMDIGEDLSEELNLILEPHGGSVVFDTKYIQKQMMPELMVILELMARGGGDDAR